MLGSWVRAPSGSLREKVPQRKYLAGLFLFHYFLCRAVLVADDVQAFLAAGIFLPSTEKTPSGCGSLTVAVFMPDGSYADIMLPKQSHGQVVAYSSMQSRGTYSLVPLMARDHFACHFKVIWPVPRFAFVPKWTKSQAGKKRDSADRTYKMTKPMIFLTAIKKYLFFLCSINSFL